MVDAPSLALCPLSLSRLVRVTRGLSRFSSDENGTVPFGADEGVIYRAEKSACRASAGAVWRVGREDAQRGRKSN